MKIVFILHAHRTDFEHKFIEIFSDPALIETFLQQNQHVVKDEITLHEVDPVLGGFN